MSDLSKMRDICFLHVVNQMRLNILSKPLTRFRFECFNATLW